MNTGIFERDGIVEGLLETSLEIIALHGQSSEAPLAGVPIAGRGVEQNLCKSGLVPAPSNFRLVESIGKQEFDCREAHLAGRSKALQKGDFLEHHAQICCEARHLNPVK